MAEVTENYLEKYKALIDEFLDEVLWPGQWCE